METKTTGAVARYPLIQVGGETALVLTPEMKRQLGIGGAEEGNGDSSAVAVAEVSIEPGRVVLWRPLTFQEALDLSYERFAGAYQELEGAVLVPQQTPDYIATLERLSGVAPLAEPRPLQTEADYDAALAAVARLMEQSPRRGTPDGERLVAFYECVEAYEDAHYPVSSSPTAKV